MKLRIKIFLCILFVALPPLILITLISYTRYISTTYDRIDDISENTFQNATALLNDRMNSIDQSSGLFTFYTDSEFSVVDVLAEFSDPDVHYSNIDIIKANNKIKFVCQDIFYTYNYIYSIYVFTPSGATLGSNTGQNGDLPYQYIPTNEQWYQDTLALKGKLYISAISDQDMFSGNKQSLFFSKALYDVYSHDFLGVLIIDCNPSLFSLDNVNTMPDITLFQLVNTRDGSLLYDNSSSVRSDFLESNLVSYSSPLSNETLVLTANYDYDALFLEYSYTAILLLVIATIFATTIIIVSLLVSKNITSPIEHLSHKMAMQNGSHLSLSGKYLNRMDEIGVLYNEYNSMVEELNNSIKKDFQDKLITMDAQMRSLEAQINSHFLFNTLESINSLAELDDDERISIMVMALGDMFRYSIKTKSELVPIEDEIKHIQNYVSIQQIRFDHKFDFHMLIPQNMWNLKVLKLILQPLVENALYHGLNYCTQGNNITVNGYIKDSFIYLTVSDNGIGMTTTELTNLQAKLNTESSFSELGRRTNQSIGLKNIHSRIELYYGKGYGISVESSLDHGTQIILLLPLLS